jgi:YVTN family beta-propeller protein
VASYKENHVTVIDGKKHKVIGSRIPVGSVPNGMGINPKTNRVYVANWQDGTVSVINGAKRKVIATIPVGSGAQEPQHCYEALVITGCTRWGSMPIGFIGVDAERNRMYVANANDGTISVINGKTNTILGNPVMVTSGKLLPDGCFDFDVCKSGSAARGALFSAKTKKLFIDAVHDKMLSVVELK